MLQGIIRKEQKTCWEQFQLERARMVQNGQNGPERLKKNWDRNLLWGVFHFEFCQIRNRMDLTTLAAANNLRLSNGATTCDLRLELSGSPSFTPFFWLCCCGIHEILKGKRGFIIQVELG